MSERLLSVGLDVGTTSTQLVVSQLEIENRASNFAVPEMVIAQRRIRAAKHLLRTTDQSISAVAEAVGVNDYNYFSKVFRGETGMTPSAYRKAVRQNDEV